MCIDNERESPIDSSGFETDYLIHNIPKNSGKTDVRLMLELEHLNKG